MAFCSRSDCLVVRSGSPSGVDFGPRVVRGGVWPDVGGSEVGAPSLLAATIAHFCERRAWLRCARLGLPPQGSRVARLACGRSALCVPEGAWGLAGRAGEELAEVGGFGEAEAVADGGDGQVGVCQQAFGLQGDAGVDELFGGVSGGVLAGAVEGLEGVAEPGGVVVGLAQDGEGAFQFVLEEAVRLLCGMGLCAAAGCGETCDAQQDPGQQLAQEFLGDLRVLVRKVGVFGGEVGQCTAEAVVVAGAELPEGRAERVVDDPGARGEPGRELRGEQDDRGVQVRWGAVGCRGQAMDLPGTDVQQRARPSRGGRRSRPWRCLRPGGPG